MNSVTEAQQIALENIPTLGTERVGILNAPGRVLAEEVVARRDHPPWDNSAMDGVAVRWEDIHSATKHSPVLLHLTGKVVAGQLPAKPVGPGEAILIMTGAPIPAGADTVVRIEETHQNAGEVKIMSALRMGDYIRRRGEGIQKGQVLLTKKTELGAGQVAMLASAGQSLVTVFRRPRVAIMATGDEVADLDEPLLEHKIYDSNSYALAAQVQEAGGIPVLLGITRDSKMELKKQLSNIGWADLLLISGGVSVGEHDYVKEVLNELGAEFKFWRVKMRPGHPAVFGCLQNMPFFGLPGNPVSTMVVFEQLVRPVLRKLQGYPAYFLPVIMAEMEEPLTNQLGRTNFVRAIVNYTGGKTRVRSTGPQGSGILNSMAQANGFIVLGENTETVVTGERVTVQLLGGRLTYLHNQGF